MKWLKKFTKKSSASEPAAKPAVLRVSDFLTPKTIHFFHAGPSKQQVLGTLISSLQLPDPNIALKAILAREEVGSTIIAPGLALPHGRIPGITRIQAALGLSPTGVLDPRGTEPIKAFVLFLGPADSMREHLAFLATLSALFQTEGLITSLVHLHSAEDVLNKLRKAEEELA
jgi:nitrogen PTS system EIIA component